jgi:hypothetical protein
MCYLYNEHEKNLYKISELLRDDKGGDKENKRGDKVRRKKTRKGTKITKEMTKNQAYLGGEGHSGKILGFSPPLLLLFSSSNRKKCDAWCANGHKPHPWSLKKRV